MLSYLQAVVIGALQGVTELFPVSSLGHSVLIPALIGGSWDNLVTDTASGKTNPYLAFVVALHVATAIALLIFFREDWRRIIFGFGRTIRPSLAARRLVTNDADERLAWLLIVGTVPVGIIGLLLEHSLRTVFAKPLAAAIFLTLNGFILLTAERMRRASELRAVTEVDVVETEMADAEPALVHVGAAAGGARPTRTIRMLARPRTSRQLSTFSYREAGVVGVFQSLALLAGISRSGVTMIGGLARGLSHQDAARFSFLLATPIILAAGVLKLPELAGPNGAHIRGQVAVGALVAGLAAYVSLKWLTRYFETRTLTPFAIYCLVAGVACTVRFA